MRDALQKKPAVTAGQLAFTRRRSQVKEGVDWTPAPTVPTAAHSKTQARAAEVIEALRAQAKTCTACPLWRNATQTVFGDGPASATIVLIGEQPGDAEDIAGQPFVGPAGRLLDQALADAGLQRTALYVTNAVKHFKWEPRGKRRLHKTPAQREIDACRRWLDAELAAIGPKLAVCLGAIATRALLGPDATIAKFRGAVLSERNPPLLVTTHPSAVLRAPPEVRSGAYAALVADLKVAARYILA